MPGNKIKVFLTGAGGRTGRLVLAKLKAHPEIDVVGLVRRQEQAQELGADVVVGDIRNPETLSGPMAVFDRLVM